MHPLKKFMFEKNYLLKDLEPLLGLTRVSIGLILNGKAEPSERTKYKINQLLQQEIYDLSCDKKKNIADNNCNSDPKTDT